MDDERPRHARLSHLDQRTDPELRDHPAPDDPVDPWPGGPRRLVIHLRLWWVLAAFGLLGAVFIVVGRLLVAATLVGAGFYLAALLRLLLDEARVGGLHIRTRLTDVVMFLGAGTAVFLATWLVLVDR